MSRLFILIGLMLISVVSSVYAMPAFARQMGVSCNTCHSQNGYPALNSFGRNFKASGYTMMGSQGTITDPAKENFLSIPETLNASFVAKIRVVDSDNSTTELQFPDEAALVIGGRVAEHVGTFIEIGYAGQHFLLANFKIPFTYSVDSYTFGAVPYLTDGFGPSASFEVLNTGAVRNARVLEERKVVSAQQYIGTATEAEGLGLYVYNKLWNVVYSAWVPVTGTVKDFTPAHYARAVLTPTIGEWDLGFGGQIWWGTAKYQDDTNPTGPLIEEKTDAYAFDFQAMGSIGDVPLSFFATYALAEYGPDSLYASTAKDISAATLLTEVAVLPAVLMLSAGYRDADNGEATDSSDNAAIAAVKYYFMENVQFQFDYTNNLDQADNRNQYLFMLYAAF
ncbi:MAG: hypothetical protein WBF77_00135 [Sulfurimonadaceae bacterium]